MCRSLARTVIVLVLSLYLISHTETMTKQEIRECFEEVLGKALSEIEKQTACYKDLITQQSIANQKVLQQQTESFKTIISEFLVSINQSVDTKCNAVSSDLVNLAKDFEALKEEHKKLQKRMEALESSQGSTRADLEKVQDDVDEVESYSRRSCLIFSNIPTDASKTDEEQVLNVLQTKLQLTEANASWIDNCHRLGKPDENNRRTIVKFAAGKYREAVWRNKGKLKSTNIIMTEQLTKKRSILLKKCIEEISGEKWVFTNNCNVLVRFGEDVPIHIKNLKQLENVKNNSS